MHPLYRPIYPGEELLLAHQRVVFGEGDELEGAEVTRLDDYLPSPSTIAQRTDQYRFGCGVI